MEKSCILKVLYNTILSLIGYGVFAQKQIRRKDFVLQYPGEVVTDEVGKHLEENLPVDCGSFLFFYEKIWYVCFLLLQEILLFKIRNLNNI